ncbi:MAG TPA: PD-(D/E)XK nuclease family protein, partial [Longimicrobiales bacterium]|nr:PD-(D/E)XK nuclease family protein [Longimicrobiales bacterium]
DARVLREAAFAHRDGDVIVEGIMDRVVLIPDGDGEPRAAEILDFKTDDVSADSDDLARRAARYAPQLEAYRKGLAATYGMDPARITTRLVFVRAGVVIETG